MFPQRAGCPRRQRGPTGCEAIQIFHQSPRAWRPTRFGSDDFDAFNAAFDDSPLLSMVIHAVYLINTATPDDVIREKSLSSLLHAVRLGDAIGASGVILHAGSRKKDPLEGAIARSGGLVREVLAETERCPILFENTAGTQGPLGRDFEELSGLVEAAGAGERIGVCIDCCHVRLRLTHPRAGGADSVVDDLEPPRRDRPAARSPHQRQRRRARSNRDKHAKRAPARWARGSHVPSEPRFEGLPALLETPGPERAGSRPGGGRRAFQLRERGLAARAGTEPRREKPSRGQLADGGRRGGRSPPGRRRRRTRGEQVWAGPRPRRRLDVGLAVRERAAGHLDSAEAPHGSRRPRRGDVESPLKTFCTHPMKRLRSDRRRSSKG